MFWLFVFSRFVVSLGQTCFTVVVPCVIADMFAGASRSCMYMLFYFAIPIGSGLGHIIGGKVAAVTGHWTWGVRITFVLGVICISLIIFFVDEPKRGAAEEEQGQLLTTLAATNYCEDLKSLSTNFTYIFATAAYTAFVFALGAVSWWAKEIIVHREAHTMGLNYTHLLPPGRKSMIDAIFGAITLTGGIVGIALGSVLSMLLRYGVGPSKCVQTERSDSIICGIGSFLAAPLVYFLLYLIPIDMVDAWITLFFTTTAMCLCWPLVVDLLVDIIIPSRRCVAVSWQTLISHAFGDAHSTYIIGMVSKCEVNGSRMSARISYREKPPLITH
ncbi:unnamed protein product [Cylicocyclus nassatus]|uniref:Major facilitator superfamily (MFS) profile domain-containing protein n=1 Tax=Cylicocyclus nassatus TaxID=53992 RepID=A0AA36GR48_CYLNA|nr:unnamed protein product [Cylicocyclus nassatus]